MDMVKIKDLAFEYIRRDEEGNVESINRAIDGVNLDVKKGDFIAVLGANGSVPTGKTYKCYFISH